MTFDLSELLTHLEDGERSLSTVPATIWTGRIPHDVGSDIDDLNLARCIAADRDFPAPDSRAPMLVVLTDRRLLVGRRSGSCEANVAYEEFSQKFPWIASLGSSLRR